MRCASVRLKLAACPASRSASELNEYVPNVPAPLSVENDACVSVVASLNVCLLLRLYQLNWLATWTASVAFSERNGLPPKNSDFTVDVLSFKSDRTRTLPSG